MISFIRNSALAYALVGPPKLPTVEEWAQMHADKATPDGIIVAAIKQRIASRFDKWKVEEDTWAFDDAGYPKPYNDDSQPDVRASEQLILRYPGNPGKALKVELHLFFKQGKFTRSYSNGSVYYDWNLAADQIKVNDVPLLPVHAQEIFDAYFEIKRAHDAANKAAAEALETMRLNNAKWDLVEEQFGMVRNGLGQIVEKKNAKEKQRQSISKAAPKARRTKPSKLKASGHARTQGSGATRAQSVEGTHVDASFLDSPPTSSDTSFERVDWNEFPH